MSKIQNSSLVEKIVNAKREDAPVVEEDAVYESEFDESDFDD